MCFEKKCMNIKLFQKELINLKNTRAFKKNFGIFAKNEKIVLKTRK